MVDATNDESLLSEVEALLKKKFSKDKLHQRRVQSTAPAAASSERIDQLVLPDEMRGRMPLTKDKYVVKENPQLVQWERETRKFLRNLTPAHGHRVSAVMIYEWATGISVAELMAEGGSAASDLRKINQVMRHYFGKGYMTWIGGRKVNNAYKIPVGWRVRRHRPLTLTLWVEYTEGTLYP